MQQHTQIDARQATFMVAQTQFFSSTFSLARCTVFSARSFYIGCSSLVSLWTQTCLK